MHISRLFWVLFLLIFATDSPAQFLSQLKAGRSDALYTTYAAPPDRTNYKTDQGYQFKWFDDESGVEFISRSGPCLGLAFKTGNRLIFKLNELYKEPIITISYSDLVAYHYYPVKNLRIEIFFAVYSSETAVFQCRMVNEGARAARFSVLPYLYLASADSVSQFGHLAGVDGYSFPLIKKRDGWMVEHQIPLAEELWGSWVMSGLNTASGWSFARPVMENTRTLSAGPFNRLLKSMAEQQRGNKYLHGFIRSADYVMEPGDVTTFRMMVNLSEKKPGYADPQTLNPDIFDPVKLVQADEKAYSLIPAMTFRNKDQEMLYWSCFSLMRQCMMPPEGESSHNYYVFSREPRWGWGYGGQVFHESLVMMAYAYMDPTGAMNSQRVFMERQRPDGYINYRTGPYLNETIETGGKPTSSAPWFNYTNLEVYKITRDLNFLKEAYVSGGKFYRYYVAKRDSNANGLCEWGAHAELESVRDARVAVWDQVGWASNFEGPDLNSMLVMEANSLAEMAGMLGLHEESKNWREDAAVRSKLINRTMWDEKSGFYYNVSRSDQSFSYRSADDLKIKEIIGFLPLWAGVPDGNAAKRLMLKMRDTAEFWRPFGIPSLSAAEKYYNPIGYWNGPVWVQWNYLLYRGMRDYGYNESADSLATRVLDNMIYHLKNDHVFWEFYSADDLQAGWNKTYIWAGIAARFLIDSQISLKTPVKNGTSN